MTQYKHSEETKEKIRQALMGHKHSEETKRKIGKANSGENNYWYGRGFWTGKKHSIKTKKILSELLKGNTRTKGHKLSPEHIAKIKAYKPTKEQREKISIANSGKGNANWKGGLSFKPYSREWTERLKRQIRERDNYICQRCNKENSKQVHHIDYNKENCKPENLLTLCNVCNSVVNFNRDYWTNYFNKVYLS